MFSTKRVVALITIIFLLFSGCQPSDDTSSAESDLAVAQPAPTATAELRPPTITPAPLATSAPPTAIPTPTQSAPTPTPKPTCQQPELPGTGRICYVARGGETFVHPVSMVSDGRWAWLIDGGRVLQIDLLNPAPPTVLLAPDDVMPSNLPLPDRVQEPLDLTLAQNESGGLELLVLDRVGDVYAYDLLAQTWFLERHDRPIGQTSSHYYLALDSNGRDRFLLETSYSYGLRYLPNQEQTGWPLDANSVLIDFAILRNSAASVAYVLQRPLDAQQAELVRYVQGQPDSNFQPSINITQPREIQVGATTLYLLDRGGQRLSAFSLENGALLSQTEFPFPLASFALYPNSSGGSNLLYVGRNAIYLPSQPSVQVDVETTEQTAFIPGRPPYDPQIWGQMPNIILPIENLPPDTTELRMPGAPRHYRQGIHEGMDFYWGPGREIRAVADGTVIRAMWDYQEPWPELFTFYRGEAAQLGETSDEALDFFRGRQIWVQHANGFITRHAHLNQIDQVISEGGQVTQGQIIGYVGNSGSPGSLDGPAVDSHLHFEIWFEDQAYLGQYWRPIETREFIEALFAR